MASAMTRVELHEDEGRTKPLSPTAAQYQKLHTAMWSKGFRRFIVGNDNKMYRLPPAEYYYAGQDARSAILEKAKAAAYTAVGSHNKYSCVVTEQNGVMWIGLQQITKDPDA